MPYGRPLHCSLIFILICWTSNTGSDPWAESRFFFCCLLAVQAPRRSLLLYLSLYLDRPSFSFCIWGCYSEACSFLVWHCQSCYFVCVCVLFFAGCYVTHSMGTWSWKWRRLLRWTNQHGNYIVFFSNHEQTGVENIPTTMVVRLNGVLSHCNLKFCRDACPHTQSHTIWSLYIYSMILMACKLLK